MCLRETSGLGLCWDKNDWLEFIKWSGACCRKLFSLSYNDAGIKPGLILKVIRKGIWRKISVTVMCSPFVCCNIVCCCARQWTWGQDQHRVGEQCFLGPHKNSERLIVLEPAHLGYPGERAEFIWCCCFINTEKLPCMFAVELSTIKGCTLQWEIHFVKWVYHW